MVCYSGPQSDQTPNTSLYSVAREEVMKAFTVKSKWVFLAVILILFVMAFCYQRRLGYSLLLRKTSHLPRKIGISTDLVKIPLRNLDSKVNAADTGKGEGLTPYINREVTTGCPVPDGQHRRFYSQSNEDWTIFNLHFAAPVICNGTFVEMGALDGLLYSNTKFFEDTLHWKGFLLEANPNNYKYLLKQRPNSVKVHGAVCDEGQDLITLAFMKVKRPLAVGGDKALMSPEYEKRFVHQDRTEVKVKCLPLRVYFREAGIRHIDFFSLDIEGSEYKALLTMDWEIPVHVFLIELGRGHDDDIKNLLEEHGYLQVKYDIKNFCLPKRGCMNNAVFVHPSYTYDV